MDLEKFVSLLPADAQRQTSERSYRKGGLVFARGDAPAYMFFVIAGEAHLSRATASGDTIVLQRCRHGFLAEASLDQAAYHCDALAVAPSRLVSIPRDAFRAALDDRRFSQFWISHLAGELRRTRAQNERLRLRSAHERIIHYIDANGRDGQLTLTQTRKAWAAELGLTHEALYRTLRSMREAGSLFIDGAVVRLRPT